MGVVAALAPLAAGFGADLGATALGLTTGLGSFLGIGANVAGDLIGAGTGALVGGLTQHSGLGALEGAVGGFGGGALAGPAGDFLGIGASAPAEATGMSALPLGPVDAASMSGTAMSTLGGDVPLSAAAGVLPFGPPDAASEGGTAISTTSGDVPLAALQDVPVGSLLNSAATGLTVPGGVAAPGVSSGLGSAINPVTAGVQGAKLMASAAGAPELGMQSGGMPLPPTPPAEQPGATGQGTAVDVPQGEYTTTPTPLRDRVPVPPSSPAQSAPAAAGSNTSPQSANSGLFGDALRFLNHNSGLLQLGLSGAAIGASALERPAIPGLGSNVTNGAINPQSAPGQTIASAREFQPLVPQQLAAASNIQAVATPLINAPNTGTLPPGMQASINQSLQDAITSIRAKYASLGDAGSTAETQDIAAARERASAEAASMLLRVNQTGVNDLSAANGVVQQAINDANLSNSVYDSIMGIQIGSNQALQQSLAQLAAASAGGMGRAVA